MKVVKIIITILAIILICYVYRIGKKHGESAIISDIVKDMNNFNTERIGDIDEIKRRLKDNEF